MVYHNWQRAFQRALDWRKLPSSQRFLIIRVSACRTTSITQAPGMRSNPPINWSSHGKSWTAGPLIYASMGTLQNRQGPIFQAIATACAGLDAQLVLSLGSHDQRLELKLPNAAIVVPFAPQLELLRRAALTITHAGLNTALESLAQGVPMVAIPITNDQPGVASRLEWLGLARIVPLARLTAHRLRACVRTVFSESHYRARAQQWKAEIGNIEGLRLAADIVERAVQTKQPVRRP